MVRKKSNIDLALLLLRVFTGGLMLFHGIAKLIHGHDKIKGLLHTKGLPEAMWLGVPFAEILAPILLIFGVFSRISGLVIAFTMIFALYLTTGFNAFGLSKTGGLNGELNFLFLVNGIVLYITGPGRYVLLSVNKRILQ